MILNGALLANVFGCSDCKEGGTSFGYYNHYNLAVIRLPICKVPELRVAWGILKAGH